MHEEQFMVEYVLDYLAKCDHHASSKEELGNLRDGIRLFLRDYGIPKDENQLFFRRYARRLLAKVARRDLKVYFLNYEDLHAIREELLDHRDEPELPLESRLTCLFALERLMEHPALEKYLPIRVLRNKANIQL